MRALLALLVALAVAGSASAAVRTGYTAEDVAALAARALDDPATAPLHRHAGTLVEVRVRDGPSVWLDAIPGASVRGPAGGAYAIALSTDALLSALNAPDPTRVLRCLARDGHATLHAPDPAEQVALRALRARVADGVDCDRPGPLVDRYGSPLGWQDPDAPRWLGRPDAGVSRLSPSEVAAMAAGAPVDLADPWRAPLAIRAQIALAGEGLCLDACPSPATIPAGDARAALEADPRTRGAP